jgi:hypothetical protein
MFLPKRSGWKIEEVTYCGTIVYALRELVLTPNYEALDGLWR